MKQPPLASTIFLRPACAISSDFDDHAFVLLLGEQQEVHLQMVISCLTPLIGTSRARSRLRCACITAVRHGHIAAVVRRLRFSRFIFGLLPQKLPDAAPAACLRQSANTTQITLPVCGKFAV